MTHELVIRAARVITPEGVVSACVAVNGGVITSVLPYDARPVAARLVDVPAECVLLPGLVDTHVHVNEPGRSEWAGFWTRATSPGPWGGIASLQLSLPAVWTEAVRRGHDLSDIVRWVSQQPADFVGLTAKGGIEGHDADFAVFAPDEQFIFHAASLQQRNPITPYDGRTLRGVVRETWLRGRRISLDDPTGRMIATATRRRSRMTTTDDRRAPSAMFATMPDLASRRFGGSAVAASDELFAERENLIKPEDPVHEAHTFGHKGQLYDGWETRRRREAGNEWALVRLGIPGVIHGVIVDTSFFAGNYRRRYPSRQRVSRGTLRRPRCYKLTGRPSWRVRRSPAIRSTSSRYRSQTDSPTFAW